MRNVDDIFALLEPNSKCEVMVKIPNSMEENIKVTYEIEMDNELHYLDI